MPTLLPGSLSLGLWAVVKVTCAMGKTGGWWMIRGCHDLLSTQVTGSVRARGLRGVPDFGRLCSLQHMAGGKWVSGKQRCLNNTRCLRAGNFQSGWGKPRPKTKDQMTSWWIVCWYLAMQLQKSKGSVVLTCYISSRILIMDWYGYIVIIFGCLAAWQSRCQARQVFRMGIPSMYP